MAKWLYNFSYVSKLECKIALQLEFPIVLIIKIRFKSAYRICA